MWKCSCGCINVDLLNTGICAASLSWKHVKHSQISEHTLDSLRIWLALTELESRKEHELTDREELFAKYYNKGKILVKDMDDATLREHYLKLGEIATEAKATQLAAGDEIREREAKKGSKEWLVTTDLSVSTSDAINVPKLRKERMSKMDKFKKDLAAYLDEDILNATVKALEQKATGANPNVETIILTKPSTEVTVIQIEKKPESKPFDWSTIIKDCPVCKQNPCRCDGLQPVLKQ